MDHEVWELINRKAANLEPADIIEKLSYLIRVTSKMGPINGSEHHRRRTNVMVALMTLEAAICDLELSL